MLSTRDQFTLHARHGLLRVSTLLLGFTLIAVACATGSATPVQSGSPRATQQSLTPAVASPAPTALPQLGQPTSATSTPTAGPETTPEKTWPATTPVPPTPTTTKPTAQTALGASPSVVSAEQTPASSPHVATPTPAIAKTTVTTSQVATLSPTAAPAADTDFAVRLLDGRVFHLADARGRPVVVLSLTTGGCAACTAQAQALIRAAAQQPTIVARALDIDPLDTPQDVAAFRDFLGGTAVLWAIDNTGTLARQLGLRDINQVIVIAPNGQTVYRGSAPADPAQFQQLIRRASVGANGCC